MLASGVRCEQHHREMAGIAVSCCCTCEEDVTGVAARPCDARCAWRPFVKAVGGRGQLLSAAHRVHGAIGSHPRARSTLVALVQDSLGTLDSRTLRMFNSVAGNHGKRLGRTVGPRRVCVHRATV